MLASAKVLTASRDLAARAVWELPHDLRRQLYLRLRPSTDELYRTMRTSRIDEVPRLSVSLVPFEEHRCIFVHIPKNGGTSIGRSLFGEYRGNHMPIRSYQMIYDKSDFDDFFKFAFVRNPFDRLLSGYQFALHGADRVGDSESTSPSNSKKPGPGEAVAPFSDFEHFVTEWLSPANARIYEHFRPQHRFVCSPKGTVHLDHVGRFETLADDFEVVADRLGIESDLMHDRRTRGSSTELDYVDHFTPATRRIAEQVFERDLRLFDYTFGG